MRDMGIPMAVVRVHRHRVAIHAVMASLVWLGLLTKFLQVLLGERCLVCCKTLGMGIRAMPGMLLVFACVQLGERGGRQSRGALCLEALRVHSSCTRTA